MDLSAEVFSLARDRICIRHPGLALALNRLSVRDDPAPNGFGTDGTSILCNREAALKLIETGGSDAEAALLHMTGHYLLGHNRIRERDTYTDMACDLLCAMLWHSAAVEYCPQAKDNRFYELIRRFDLYTDPITLSEAMRSDDFVLSDSEGIAELLRSDDHSVWQLGHDALPPCSGHDGDFRQLQLKLLHARRHTGFGTGSGNEIQKFRPNADHRTDGIGELAQLLHRYAVYREHARTDPDSLQPSWYLYGLERYGNTPLIEPLEYSEEYRLDSLVIAIDTSASCSHGLTQRFLEIIYQLIREHDLFFRRFELRIMQCDTRLQHEDRITNLREFQRYIEELTIHGGGGTDFRPVIERTNTLIRTGKLRSLKGLLYFSDGRGIFPSAPPAYELTFVMIRHRYDDIDIPFWVRRVILDAPVPKGEEY